MSLQKNLLVAGVAALCLSAATAEAAGFQLKEQSSSMQGHAFAGASAKGDDLSTMFFNPAGMTRLAEGNQFSVVASYILPSTEFTATSAIGGPTLTDNDGGDAGVGAMVPSFYSSFDLGLGSNWRTGVAVNTPFGLSTKYNNDWVGRYYALESELLTINVAPTVAYRFSDTFSVGGNVQAQYIEARLTNAINSTAILGGPAADGRAVLEGDDVAFGWGLGALWEPTDTTRVGLNYRSRIVHKLEGDIDISGPIAGLAPAVSDADVTAGVTTPDILSLGVVHDLTDRWSVLGEVAYTNWSLFDDLTVIDDTGLVRQSVDQSYDDTIFVSIGAEYKYTPDWTLRGGLAYDQSAVDTEHRTFRIPETDRIWTSLGATYAMADNVSLDMNYTYIFARDASVTEDDGLATGSGAVTGDFDSHVNIATVGVNFKF